MVYSAFVDLVWMITWIPFWRDSEIFPDGYWENKMHNFVSLLALVAWVLKVFTKICIFKFKQIDSYNYHGIYT